VDARPNGSRDIPVMVRPSSPADVANNAGLYIQDDWQISSQLRSFRLRWD
jgi:hypothetical protein